MRASGCVGGAVEESRCTGRAAMQFTPFAESEIPAIRTLLASARWRTCDFTVGGIYLWADMFRYTRFVDADTLFISGVSEDDTSRQSFSLPIGLMSAGHSVSLLRKFCAARSIPLRFSAVPEGALDTLRQLGARSITELTDWADYLYSAQDLATLHGKRYNRKRNHVNRFIADNPQWRLLPLDSTTVAQALELMQITAPTADDGPMAGYEHAHAEALIRNFDTYASVMTGGVLTTPEHGIVALTVGEVQGDTLHLHIEKADHRVAGAGEAINQLFAAEMLRRYPRIAYINRQDAGGDEGLRQAKESYHPIALLRKFNVVM